MRVRETSRHRGRDVPLLVLYGHGMRFASYCLQSLHWELYCFKIPNAFLLIASFRFIVRNWCIFQYGGEVGACLFLIIVFVLLYVDLLWYFAGYSNTIGGPVEYVFWLLVGLWTLKDCIVANCAPINTEAYSRYYSCLFRTRQLYW
jgi:hypothetical protein